MLKGKNIIVGITGGIAAYKSAYLVRELVKQEASVQVIMTSSATQFVAPLTFSTLSKRKALVGLFPPSTDVTTEHSTEHVDLAIWADVMVVAPATANTIAKLAHGLADDFLTTLALALRCPLVVAPAMDVDMYLNAATQQNIDALRESGSIIINPDAGELASGLSGPGRLPEVEHLVQKLDHILEHAHRDLNGTRVLVTAGPTYEPVDPVRFIGNRSSGKMGFALANAAAHRGAEVTLIAGPVSLRTPRNVRRIDVETAEQMMSAVDQEFDSTDVVLMAAAVGDFSASQQSTSKIKRDRETSEVFTLQLNPNPDILQALGRRKKNQKLIGFALETDDGVKNAQSKLKEKNLDVIVLNDPNVEGAGFNTDTNVVSIITPDGLVEALPRMSKYDVAHAILSRTVALSRS